MMLTRKDLENFKRGNSECSIADTNAFNHYQCNKIIIETVEKTIEMLELCKQLQQVAGIDTSGVDSFLTQYNGGNDGKY